MGQFYVAVYTEGVHYLLLGVSQYFGAILSRLGEETHRERVGVR